MKREQIYARENSILRGPTGPPKVEIVEVSTRYKLTEEDRQNLLDIPDLIEKELHSLRKHNKKDGTMPPDWSGVELGFKACLIIVRRELRKIQ